MNVLSVSKVAQCVRVLRVDTTGKFLAVMANPREDLIICELAGHYVTLQRTLASSALQSDAPMVDMVFHPLQPFLAVSGQDRSITIWDASRGVRVTEFGLLDDADTHPEHGFWGLVFSACGRYIDTHSRCRECGERYEWQTGKLVATRWGTGGPLVLHGEGELLGVTSVREMATVSFIGRWNRNIFEWYSPELTSWFPVTRAVFGAGLLGFIGGSGRLHLQVHEFPSCRVRFYRELELTPEHVEYPFDVSEALAITKGGRIFGPSISGRITEWAAADGEEIGSCHAHEGMIMSLDLHPSQPLLISGGWDGTIAVVRIQERYPPSIQDGATENFLRLFRRRDADPQSGSDSTVVYFEP